ncbi:hypothetical protein GGR56DRAFT_676575 [Xylariaceae sp. FL0804]|nr:hypothetical protein GGR56DRAFT_676575 [Xylariaceae sp. FL0804]
MKKPWAASVYTKLNAAAHGGLIGTDTFVVGRRGLREPLRRIQDLASPLAVESHAVPHTPHTIPRPTPAPSAAAAAAAIPHPRPRLPRRTANRLLRPRPRLSLITTDLETSGGIPLKMRFQAPQLGALGVTFTALRAMQFVALLGVVGLTANFINDFVTSQREVPDVLVGTIAVTSIASLYVTISYILYYDGLLPLLVAGGMDLALLVASIVVAVTVGKPLSMLNCSLLPNPHSSSSSSSSSSSYSPYTSTGTSSYSSTGTSSSSGSSSTLGADLSVSISTRDAQHESAAERYASYVALVAADQANCYEIKAVWGLGIALCVLFAFTALVCVGLWHRVRSSTSGPNKGDDFGDFEA